jgi:hypothetical protein
VGDALLQRVDVVGGAEAGPAPGLFAEKLGQALFELADAGVEAKRALLRGEQAACSEALLGKLVAVAVAGCAAIA